MSRFLTRNPDGTYLEEIESMEECKWKINEVCCNENSPDLADYPYPRGKGCKAYLVKRIDIVRE